MILKDDSVLKELQDNLIRYKMFEIPRTIEHFLDRIKMEESPAIKLSLFRLCCLIVSHRLLMVGEQQFNHLLLADIVYFYAFTHTYFSASEFHSFDAEEISVTISEIMGEKATPNEKR